MLQSLSDTPGRWYVVATLLPLAAFVVLLAAGALRALCRGAKGGIGARVFKLLGGDKPLKMGAYFATAVMAASAVISVYTLVTFLGDAKLPPEKLAARWAERTDWVRIGPIDTTTPTEFEKKLKNDPERPTPRTGLALELGYKIDHLTAVIFAMVAVIATFIFLFSIGYMKDETHEVVHDHDAHAHRKGRYGRFFLYLSLFCFSMFNLVISDNLFQVFVSWELVGVCSFFLIGFYYERPSASRAANKAFIVNRVGDAGFLVGILVAWTTLGTLNFDEMFRRLRSPEKDSHGRLDYAHQFIRVNKDDERRDDGSYRYRLPPQEEFGAGTHLALFPLAWEVPEHYHGMGYNKEKHNKRFLDAPPSDDYFAFGAMPYWLFVVMGVGVFLGCVGKSAQVPLHTWLPDAMEGPTPVSALIHAATMVAAGVYLVGRCFPMFAPEVLLMIAYVGAFTAFFAATVAVAQTDIKRVLAYSTCSQLGFMMLALGVGGWVAGLLHLVTHAFFKALLFLGSGSVIHGCHHEQDIRKMGGLGKKMPITGATMLIGVLAISGMPLLSGWYSKDMILSASLGYVKTHPQHALLFALPAITAGLTAFYMFRLWFLTFTGKPRDEKVYEHAHESPWTMTFPLMFLAVCSIGIAWGWPVWKVESSALAHVIEKAEHPAVLDSFGPERVAAHDAHTTAGVVALVAAALGFGLALVFFGRRQPTDQVLYKPGPVWYRFLRNKWYFDEAYDATIVNPTLALAKVSAAVDKRPTESPTTHEPLPAKHFDLLTLDGWQNAVGQAANAIGVALRGVQTGQLRTYVVFLTLTAVALLTILAVLTRSSS